MATRAELRTRARARADQDGSGFPSDAQYNEWLADSVADVWNRLIAAGGVPGRTEVSVTATGAATYSVASDVHSVLSVDRQEGSQFFPLRPVQLEDVPGLRSVGTGPAEFYGLLGGATSALLLELLPRPASGTYSVRYIPQAVRWTSDSDAWLGPARTDEYLVLVTANRALKKGGDDAGPLAPEIRDLWAEVVQHLPWRDAQGPGRVRDVMGRLTYLPGDFRVAGVDDW